jgi:choline kinase
LTLSAPKCLTEVGGEPILGRLIHSLRSQGIARMVVVTGYLDRCVRDYVNRNAVDLQVDYVFNPVFQTTNNIYSLWLARQIVTEPFMLVECDLVFEPSMLEGLLTPDTIAISRILPWMNGTKVELDGANNVSAFRMGTEATGDKSDSRYKTVNICSLSSQSWLKIGQRLDRFVCEKRVGEYYESVFSDLVEEGALELNAVFFDESRWYEIDTALDLQEAELMFPCQANMTAAYAGI